MRLYCDEELVSVVYEQFKSDFGSVAVPIQFETVAKPVSPFELSLAEKLGWKRVGTGMVTNSDCGRLLKTMGCNHVKKHNFTSLDGVNHAGDVYVQFVYGSCGKASCPVCARFGWAVRQTKVVEVNIKEVSKRLGQPEHFIVGVPPEFYGLTYETICAKVMKGLSDRGIHSGFRIPHAERYANRNEAKRKNFLLAGGLVSIFM